MFCMETNRKWTKRQKVPPKYHNKPELTALNLNLLKIKQNTLKFLTKS